MMFIVQQITADFATESGPMSLCYALLRTEGIYGVSIENRKTGEKAQVEDLTGNDALARLYFNRLVQGHVTPLCLKETAEDFIAEA